ncbi:DUF6461 domain-containing protein [Streptosporangium sp. NPDC002544]|uniref:DUF6461 domain-containing protein n=1 Tax=Streptosporangium sp. NPDC002544 TaxID=3154538 RepID=UPI00331F5B7A
MSRVKITYADVAWLAKDYGLGEVWCLTLVRGLDEAEVLRRMSAREESIRPLTYRKLMDEELFPGTVLVGRLDGWSALIEVSGWQGTKPDVLRVLSAGTEVVSVLRHDYAAHEFVYAVDGERVTFFDPVIPAWRYGSDPDRLVDAMSGAGFDPGYEPVEEGGAGNLDHPVVDGALLLMARLTGVMLTQDVLSGSLLSGVIATHRS